jgi:hypothetical protein
VFDQPSGGVNVANHAIALGYFFLAAFCALASAHGFRELRVPMLVAAMLALVAGVGYVARPLGAGFRAGSTWLVRLFRDSPARLVRMIRLAQEPPTRAAATMDERSA